MKAGMRFAIPSALCALALLACSSEPEAVQAPAQSAAQQNFMAHIGTLCGRAFEGRLVSDDEADAEIAEQRLVMHVAQCQPGQVRIPFHVGEDRSRTWVFTLTGEGEDARVRLKHDHRHDDGSEDVLTQYGGTAADAGTRNRQEFPADAESIALFEREAIPVSAANVWAVEIDTTKFAYELRRPESADGRFFRVEFDLTEEVDMPPAAWGSEGGT